MAANMNEWLLQDNVQNAKTATTSSAQAKDPTRTVDQAMRNIAIDQTGLDRKKEAILRAKTYTLLAQLKFEEAATALEEMQPTPDVDTNLLAVECFLQVGRERKALKAIDEIKHVLLTPPSPDASEIVALADNFIENSCFIRAIVLLQNAASMYSKFGSSDEGKLAGIRSCIEKTSNAVGAMVQAGDRLRVLAIDYGIEYMVQMRELLRPLSKVHREKKTLEEAWCINLVGYNQCLVGQNAKSIEVRKSGLAVMDSCFGENAMKYRVYGALLHNIAVGYFNSNKYPDAEVYYSKAVEAKTKALDHDSDEKREEDIELSNQGLIKTVQNLP